MKAEALSELQRRAVLWYSTLRRTSNDVFLPLFHDSHRWLVLMGGAGSGKSNFAARKVIERCMGEPGHRFLVCRKVAATLRESCYALLCAELERYYPASGIRATVSPMQIRFPNGSVILFGGLDDSEKLKSIHRITSVWIEEASECDEADADQLNLRLRDESPYYRQIIVTFNPISATHWLKKKFFDRTADNVRTVRSTYRDNRFLPAEYGEELERYRDTDPYYYAVYALGEWGVLGQTVFPAAAVTERLAQIRACAEDARVGLYVYEQSASGKPFGRHFAEAEDGCVTVWAAAEPGVPYVIGADTAGEGSDAFCAHVLDNRTGEQAAVLRMVNGEAEFAAQLYCLACEYNEAYLAVEANFSTYVNTVLAQWGYANLHIRETEDTYTGRLRKSYGFLTTAKNRNLIIAELVTAVRGSLDLIHDARTLEEMLTFVRNEDYRPEAEAGAHDDLIMSLAIANHVRPMQRRVADVPERAKVKWTADMWEDWRSASADEKEYLLTRWGDPGIRR